MNIKLTFLAGMIQVALAGLVLMIAAGAIHHDIELVPALGYISSTGIAAVVSAIAALWRGVTTE